MRSSNPSQNKYQITDAWFPFEVGQGMNTVTIPDPEAESTDFVIVTLDAGGQELGQHSVIVTPKSGYGLVFQNTATKKRTGRILIMGTVIT